AARRAAPPPSIPPSVASAAPLAPITITSPAARATGVRGPSTTASRAATHSSRARAPGRARRSARSRARGAAPSARGRGGRCTPQAPDAATSGQGSACRSIPAHRSPAPPPRPAPPPPPAGRRPARDRLVALSHRIHAHPELSFEEERAAAWCAEALDAAGFAVERGVGGLPTAFVARAGSGPLHLALCAEYDCLPGIGHACGHNLIA